MLKAHVARTWLLNHHPKLDPFVWLDAHHQAIGGYAVVGPTGQRAFEWVRRFDWERHLDTLQRSVLEVARSHQQVAAEAATA